LPAGATGVQSIAYNSADNTFTFVNKKNPVRIFKAKIENPSVKTLTVLESLELPLSFPSFNISDAAFSPRISNNLFLLSDESKKIMEVAFSKPVPGYQSGEVISEFSFLSAFFRF
jgi:uncharacterized protein YjiK